jgi:hypothetical protein
LKLIHRIKVFVTRLKDHCLVSLCPKGGYIAMEGLEWSRLDLQNGIVVKLKKIPFLVRSFKMVATHGEIDWIIANDLSHTISSQVVQNGVDVAWQIGQLQREFKQLTGSEKCECRSQDSQHNHPSCCYQAWFSLKVKADELGKTLYAIKHDLLYEFLQAELPDPRIPAYAPI